MKRPERGRGLFYSRDSLGNNDQTPPEYVAWARRRARELGVAFGGTPECMEQMLKNGRSVDGDLFFDAGISGNVASRTGLDALNAESARDRRVSHLFIPRRDRLSRPDDPIEAMMLENSLRSDGLTLVFMNAVAEPLPRGYRQSVAELLAPLLEYSDAGRFRKELAQKMVHAQLHLARLGYSTGGRPPFGFRRNLVRVDGTVIRELEEGEVIRSAGHHVIWLPGPKCELELILRILDLLSRMPATQVAKQLNREGIPSPDAGRMRKDNGIRHEVSGRWNPTTIINIARNPLLVALVQWGRRSMGDQSRFSAEGPRDLEDSDFRADGKPKVIRNPEDTCVNAPGRFEAVVNPEKHSELISELNRRAGSQRGKPRSRSPEKNPLGGRVFDIACGWPMYRVPYAESYKYKCGCYQQSGGQECSHNHVDGPQAARFLLSCIRQRLGGEALREQLEQRLRTLARQHAASAAGQEPSHRDCTQQAELVQVRQQLETVGRNLALAESPEQYKAVSTVFDNLKAKETKLTTQLGRQPEPQQTRTDPDAEVEAALDVLRRLEDLVGSDRQQNTKPILDLVNARLFLSFKPIQIKKRLLNKLTMAVVTMGDAPPPVKLYAGPTGRRGLKKSTATVAAVTGESVSPVPPTGGEAVSLGNVNRGDRI